MVLGNLLLVLKAPTKLFLSLANVLISSFLPPFVMTVTLKFWAPKPSSPYMPLKYIAAKLLAKESPYTQRASQATNLKSVKYNVLSLGVLIYVRCTRDTSPELRY